MAVHYDIPMIFSQDYIEGLNKIHSERFHDKIESVYGSLNTSTFGQARFSSKIPTISLSVLKEHINEMHQLGIKFHYTVNCPWSELKERQPEVKNQFLKEIENLIHLGIDALILANPYLIKLIKNEFPELKIIASINFQTTTVFKFKTLLDYGCHLVVLDRPVNRNISFLKKLKNQTDNFSLLVNSICLFDCPLQQYHANENGYFSSGKNSDIENPNYCIDYCLTEIDQNPENILKSTWIRPEDISRYENIGVKHFKIQGRTLDSNILLEIIRAYLNKKTPDDKLFFIFPDFIKRYPDIANKLKNTKLNKLKFIDYFFEKSFACEHNCIDCDYCTKIIKQLIQ